MVRDMAPTKALSVLSLTPKAAAKDLSLAIKVALAGAKQLGLSSDKLFFKTLEINESAKMRRFRAAARGRARPYKRRMSHIKIILTDEKQIVDEKGGKTERDPSLVAQDDKKV